MILTKNIIKMYEIEIGKQLIERPLIGNPISLYSIVSEKLKINWSGVGAKWLADAKKHLISIIKSDN